jgi:hypothetical protein
VSGTLDALVGCTQLEQLFIDASAISGSLPQALADLPLQILGVGNSRLSGTLDPSFGRWPLRHLLAHNALLTGTLPPAPSNWSLITAILFNTSLRLSSSTAFALTDPRAMIVAAGERTPAVTCPAAADGLPQQPLPCQGTHATWKLCCPPVVSAAPASATTTSQGLSTGGAVGVAIASAVGGATFALVVLWARQRNRNSVRLAIGQPRARNKSTLVGNGALADRRVTRAASWRCTSEVALLLI